MPQLPELYKKNSNGNAQMWAIEYGAFADPDTDGGSMIGRIAVEYGILGGETQVKVEYIKKGKNIGRANETTPVQQAEAEAKARWEKQKKKGYVETVRDAMNGKVDTEVIEGGVAPMLAQSYSKHAEKIAWPAYVQKKLDGCRCIAVIKNGKATLWTRTRKPIRSMPHIVAALEHHHRGQTVTLDGELYAHSFHNNFEGLMKLVRPDAPVEGHRSVQYHVYDVVDTNTAFSGRLNWLVQNVGGASEIQLVSTYTVRDEDELFARFESFLAEGYEGLIVRNPHTKYEAGKRSYGLQKVKEMVDDEFPIVGVEEGRGDMAGKAIFVCKAKNGEEFRCKMEGSLESLEQYLTNPRLWRGKKLTVKYQNLTKYGKPRFPVGKAIRDYE